MLVSPPPGSLRDFPVQVVLTPEATPAGDIAGVVLRQQGTFFWDAGHLDGVAQLHRLSQLDDGNVIPRMQSGGLAGRPNRQDPPQTCARGQMTMCVCMHPCVQRPGKDNRCPALSLSTFLFPK